MTRLTPLIASLALALPLASAGAAQQKANATLYTREAGGEIRAAIEIRIEPGWHLYHEELGPPDAVGLPTTVELAAEGVAWSRVRFPEPVRLEQPAIGADGADTWIWGHEGRIVLRAAGRREAGAAPGPARATLSGVTCEVECLPYGEEIASSGSGPDALFAAFPTDLVWPGADVDGAGPPDGGRDGGPPDGGASGGTATGAIDYAAVAFPAFAPQTEEAHHGLVVWMLLAFLAGMLLNVMPCVLPVISIKVLSFVQQAGEDRRRIVALGLAFAAGILAVFWGLAALAIAAGLSWGEQFQSQTFLIAMIAIVFALSLSLFGVFELGVPSGVGALAGGRREGLPDAFVKGMLATLLATPCSGPFLGSTLTWTLAQPALVVLLIFTMLGLGMALPYVILTANPALLKRLPRPGPWMDTFKHAMGFVLLATVIYLMVSLRQDLLLFTAAFLVFVAMGSWFWGRFARLDQGAGRRAAVLLVALAIVGGGAQLSFGGFRGLFREGAAAGDRLDWEAFDPTRFQEQLDQGRSILVDFTADWCPNCKWNERVVYESERIRGLIEAKRVLCLKADITRKTPYTDMLVRLRDQLGARSIPFLAIFPGDRPQAPVTRKDVVTQDDIAAVLQGLPDPARESGVAGR